MLWCCLAKRSSVQTKEEYCWLWQSCWGKNLSPVVVEWCLVHLLQNGTMTNYLGYNGSPRELDALLFLLVALGTLRSLKEVAMEVVGGDLLSSLVTISKIG